MPTIRVWRWPLYFLTLFTVGRRVSFLFGPRLGSGLSTQYGETAPRLGHFRPQSRLSFEDWELLSLIEGRPKISFKKEVPQKPLVAVGICEL